MAEVSVEYANLEEVLISKADPSSSDYEARCGQVLAVLSTAQAPSASFDNLISRILFPMDKDSSPTQNMVHTQALIPDGAACYLSLNEGRTDWLAIITGHDTVAHAYHWHPCIALIKAIILWTCQRQRHLEADDAADSGDGKPRRGARKSA